MAFDKLDKRIVRELYLDGRAQFSSISKKARVSKEVVQYRIKRLEERGYLSKVIPLVNFPLLEYSIYRVQIKFFSNVDYVDFFKKIKQTSWIVELSGKFDVVVLFWIKEQNEFFEIYKKIQSHFKDGLNKIVFNVVSSITYFAPNYLLDKKESKNYSLNSINDKIEINESQEKILKKLLENGRESVLQIAKELNFSATNVIYHIKKMIKERVILGFIPIINFEKLGFIHYKIVINLKDPSKISLLKEEISKSKNTIYITRSFGTYDLEFEFVCKNINELFVFMKSLNSKIAIKDYDIIFGNKEILVNEVV